MFLRDQEFLSLGYSETGAAAAVSFWGAACYLTPVLGAVLADARWGRFTTILRFGLVYAVGVSALAGAAVGSSAGGAVAALALIALGAGGIKPCVGPFGADQLVAAAEASQGAPTVAATGLEGASSATGAASQIAPADAAITSYYFALYFCINCGSSLSFFAMKPALDAWGFAGAYAMCASVYAAAVVAFAIPTLRYARAAPEGSAVLVVASVTSAACRARCCKRGHGEQQPLIRGPSGRSSGNGGESGVASKGAADPFELLVAAPPLSSGRVGDHQGGDTSVGTGESWTDKAALGDPAAPATLRRHPPPPTSFFDAARGAAGICDSSVDDVAALARLAPLFCTLPLFWCLFDSYATTWQLQARSMNLCLGGGTSPPCIAAFQMGAADSLLVLLMVPLAGCAVPALARAARSRPWLEPTPLRRMTVGMFVAAAAFAVSALLEARINAAPPKSVPVLWQFPQYAVLVVAEILVSTTGLEFSFIEAGPGNRSAVLSAFYLATAAGDALNGVLYSALGQRLQPIALIWLVAGLQLGAALVFAGLARVYVPRAVWSAKEAARREGEVREL